jgi:hypothetical protein
MPLLLEGFKSLTPDISFMWHKTSVREKILWYKISVREELIEKILGKLTRSERREQGVEKYAHDYVYGLKLGVVKPGNEKLVKEGTERVYRKIDENRNK